jgi:N-methylhydantoinase B
LERIVTHPDGGSLCQSSYSPPNFWSAGPIRTKNLLAQFLVETLLRGDVLATNDPWLGAGHLSVVAPDYPLALAREAC